MAESSLLTQSQTRQEASPGTLLLGPAALQQDAAMDHAEMRLMDMGPCVQQQHCTFTPPSCLMCACQGLHFRA